MFLGEHGIQFWPSQANFVLFRAGAGRNDARAFAERMRKQDILVRDRSSDYGCEGCIRITLGTRRQTNRLLEALQQTLPVQQGVAT
jgi:histidinol-phosphate aminotransferase